jgi:hypothetical protein
VREMIFLWKSERFFKFVDIVYGLEKKKKGWYVLEFVYRGREETRFCIIFIM